MSHIAPLPDPEPAPYLADDLLADLALFLPLVPGMMRALSPSCACCGAPFCDSAEPMTGGTLLTCGDTEALGLFALCRRCDAHAFLHDDKRIEEALRATPPRGMYIDADDPARRVLAHHVIAAAVDAVLHASCGKPVALRTARLAWRLKGFSTDVGLDRWALLAWKADGRRLLARAPFPWRPEDPPALTGVVAEEARDMAVAIESGRLVVNAAAWTAGLPILIAEEHPGPEVTQ